MQRRPCTRLATRQCTRGLFGGKPLSTGQLKLLETTGAANGVLVVLLGAKPEMEKVFNLVLQGNTKRLSDVAFVKGPKQLLRLVQAKRPKLVMVAQHQVRQSESPGGWTAQFLT